MVTHVEDMAEALRSGASADIWYDADDHVRDPDDASDPDVVASRRIERTQLAMEHAASEVVLLHGLLSRMADVLREAGLGPERESLVTEVAEALARLGAEVEVEPDAPTPSL